MPALVQGQSMKRHTFQTILLLSTGEEVHPLHVHVFNYVEKRDTHAKEQRINDVVEPSKLCGQDEPPSSELILFGCS